MQVLVDCTGLHADPLLTGIQRVTREMLRQWPQGDAALCPVRFDPARGLVAIDPPSLALLLGESARDDAALRRELRDRAASAEALSLEDHTLVAIPEVFFDPARAWFHHRRLRRNPGAVALLSYDFIPWLQPDLFPLHTVVSLMPYLRLVRDARHVAFISERTKRDYATRILRRPDHREGPVLPLGADGLGMERQSWSPDRHEFVSLGSIDGRKNQHRIAEAFELLWQAGSDARLTLLGRVFEGADRAWLDRIMPDPRFRWIDHPDQETVATVLRDARATIYVSAAEGFGLPPVESLMAGIPVIATANIPSLEGLPPGCHIRLPAAEPSLIADAVSALLDDRHAAIMWQEASSVQLATWRDFGTAMANWTVAIARAAETSAGPAGNMIAWRGEQGGLNVAGQPKRPTLIRKSSPATLPSDPAFALPLEPRRPLIRRLARRALRLLRPLAAPLLHRLDVRMRWAVDRTATAAAVHALVEAGQRQPVQDDTMSERLRAEILSAVGELRTELLTRLDLLALSTLREQRFQVGIAALEARLQEHAQNSLRADLLPLLGVLVERADSALVQGAGSAEVLQALLDNTGSSLRRFALPLGTETAVRTDFGYLLVPLEDQALLLSMVETAGRLEPGTLSVMLALLQPGDLMLDVGANIGTLCLPAARQVGSSGRIIALEPTPRTASVLRRSLALNGLEDRVEVLQCAAGETEEVGRLAVSAMLTHNSLMPLDEESDQIEVPIRPLDACVPAGQAVRLAKLDVEGAELQAWRGMSRIIAENPELAVIVEFGPSHLKRAGITIEDWLSTMCAPGFTAWEIDEVSGNIRPLREQGLADVFSMNLLLLRQHPSTLPRLHLA